LVSLFSRSQMDYEPRLVFTRRTTIIKPLFVTLYEQGKSNLRKIAWVAIFFFFSYYGTVELNKVREEN
jgi:hypothetical protein